MRPVLIFLCLWVTALSSAQKTDKMPVIISIPPQEYKIATLTDSIFGEPARVIFVVDVSFENPLCDSTKEIRVIDVEIVRLRVKLLKTDKQQYDYDIKCEARNKDAFQQKICQHFSWVFLYLFQHQPYEKMGDRKSFSNRVLFGGSVYIVPPNNNTDKRKKQKINTPKIKE
ncbi:MAG: hypothetical protein FWF52_03785 [Candidatus Azobacteroides sp.]|nr:hypothetical protein [Candidatus Azobacteroides sp.]